MKHILILFFLVLSLHCHGQKPLIQLETYKEWPTVGNGQLSLDGKYATYIIHNQPVGRNTLVLRNLGKGWEFKFSDLSNAIFSENSKFLIGTIANDTLLIFDMATKKSKKIPNIKSFKLFSIEKNYLLAYHLSKQKKLNLKSLVDESETTINDVDQYHISDNGKSIIIEQIDPLRNKEHDILYFYDVKSHVKHKFYEGKKVGPIVFDARGQQVAFITKDSVAINLWCYKQQNVRAINLIDSINQELKNDVDIIDENFGFSKDGESLFFSVEERVDDERNESKNLSIWSYKDTYLRSYYEANETTRKKKYLGTININTKNFRQLLRGNQKIVRSSINGGIGDILVVESSSGLIDETFIASSKASYFICNTKTGVLSPFELNKPQYLQSVSISPDEKVIVYYDPEIRNYISYNISTGHKINITKTINQSLGQYYLSSYPEPGKVPAGLIKWIDNSSILIHSISDIWLVDAFGKIPCRNITQGLGQRYKLTFNLTRDSFDNLSWNSNLFLIAFNHSTKEISLYVLRLDDKKGLKLLYSSPNYFEGSDNSNFTIPTTYISFSQDGKSCLMLMQSASKAPNYYFSNSLNNFKSISDVHPQLEFNWLTDQLCSYLDSDGKKYEGILYKPEDFDPSKSYPILINYYTLETNTLNRFPTVNLPNENFSIATAVSNGYLVYLPDILSEIGKPGESALRSVNESVRWLSTFSWADTSKIGIAGHSHGGFETNYIITHSKKFKAAISGAGISNLTSESLDIWEGIVGFSKINYWKSSVPKMGYTLLETPENYIANSPVFNSCSVSTPILLMHNTKDDRVPFQQSRQFFIALRSLKKPVWWLNYTDEQHVIIQEDNKLDYNKKAFEFFDHFLKGAPAPNWMVSHL